MNLIGNMCEGITQLLPHISGASELTHWPWEIWIQFQKCKLQSCLTDWYLIFLNDNVVKWMPKYLTDGKSRLG